MVKSLLASLAALLLGSNAFAAIAGFSLVGTGAPNDSEAVVNAMIAPQTTQFLAKLDCGGNVCDIETDGLTDAANFTVVNASDGKSGTFTFSTTAGVVLEYIAVKAGPDFALYALDAPATSGTFAWNTFDLFVGNGKNNPAISHISFYGSPSFPDISEVPLPAAALIFPFGAALLYRRRKQA